MDYRIAAYCYLSARSQTSQQSAYHSTGDIYHLYKSALSATMPILDYKIILQPNRPRPILSCSRRDGGLWPDEYKYWPTKSI